MTVWDINGDGYVDVYGQDTNGDGHDDAWAYDSNEDGHAEMIAYDTNHDGHVDVVAYDSDRDGQIDTVGYDYNQDGHIDAQQRLNGSWLSTMDDNATSAADFSGHTDTWGNGMTPGHNDMSTVAADVTNPTGAALVESGVEVNRYVANSNSGYDVYTNRAGT